MRYKLKLPLYILSLLILVTLSYLSFRTLTTYTIKKFNYSLVSGYAETAHSAFSRRLEAVEKMNRDWAQWDDSYQFVQDRNEEFIKGNLIDETLQSANLNLIIYFDTEGYIVYKKATSLGGIGDTTIPAEVFNSTTNTDKINIKKIINSGKQQSGFLYTTTGTFLYSVTPITTSEGVGPSTGALMMARYINDSDAVELKKSTGLDIDILEIQQAERYHDGISLRDLEKGNVIVEKDNTLNIYLLAKDSWEVPAKVLFIRHSMVGIKDSLHLTIALTALSGTLAILFSLVVSKFMLNTEHTKVVKK